MYGYSKVAPFFLCSTEQIEEHEKTEVKNDQEAKGGSKLEEKACNERFGYLRH
jgi:hypothetical protein